MSALTHDSLIDNQPETDSWLPEEALEILPVIEADPQETLAASLLHDIADSELEYTVTAVINGTRQHLRTDTIGVVEPSRARWLPTLREAEAFLRTVQVSAQPRLAARRVTSSWDM